MNEGKVKAYDLEYDMIRGEIKMEQSNHKRK